MKKSKFRLVAIIMVVLLLFSGVVYAEQVNTKIFMNGHQVVGDAPLDFNGRELMVPFGGIWKALHATLTVNNDGTAIYMDIPGYLPPRSVVNFWDYDRELQIPAIDGPDDFKADMTEAYLLLKDKLPNQYRAAVTYISGISLEDFDGTAEINTATQHIKFSNKMYKQFKKADHDDTIVYLAGVLVHEAAHAQTGATGMWGNLTSEDRELISEIVEYRTAQALQADSRYQKSLRQWIQNYASKLK